MAKIPDVEIADAARSAGFVGNDLVIAVAVALAESSGDPDALNPAGRDDHGLWQINGIHKSILASGNWRNPQDNARMAKAVWDKQGWNAWVQYKNGAYFPFMVRAKKAVMKKVGDIETDDPLDIITDPIEAISNVGSFFTDANNISRVVMFIVGSALVMVGVVRLTGGKDFAKKAGKLALTVFTKGKL